ADAPGAGTVIVEGPLARNRNYLLALQALLPGAACHTNADSVEGTAKGAWGLVHVAHAALLEPLEWQEAQAARVVEVPVCYGGEHGPDLASVAAACGLSPQGLIDLHAGAQVRVLMMGFAPGLPYIGSFDTRLAVPRRPQPRMAVPGGSIGLANRQSVIYPFTLPGGWSLIGRTPMQLFDPNRDPACLLQAGDGLRFVPISAATFGALAGAR
ncbi:5-oxoprolinase subunit PxpB, partial [Verminephrobacter sp. Larva24]